MTTICIAGKNNIAVNAVDYLLKTLKINPENLLIITNRTDDGVDRWQKSLKKYALDNNLKQVELEEVYNISDLVFISLEFDRLIKVEKFKTSRLFNMHFSKLPAYKGMYTSIMPILYAEIESGVTFHKIDNGIDTGDIVKQKVFQIDLSDTARDLYFKYLSNSFELFKDVINDVLAQNIKTYQQPKENASYFSKTAVDFSNINIDFNKTSFEIYNQIRAFIFEEYQLPAIDGFNIEKVVLKDEKIAPNTKIFSNDKIVASGIDGYKIEAFIKKGQKID